jgi:crotonobetainyl-CoA:carnitine CoA-transferase CaiB-like acyl-CoA transferase
MLEAMAHFAIEPFAAFFATGIVPTSADRPRLAQAYILRTADDRLIAIPLSSLEKFWTGLVAALVRRGRTGQGGHVEVSMIEAMAHFAIEPFAAFFALGETPTSADRPRLAQAYILRTADDRLIAIHLSSLEKFWTGLVAALAAPELGIDPRFNPRERRIAEYDTLRLELDERFSRQPLAHWVERLRAADVPHAAVNRINEVVNDPQVKHLGVVVPIESPHTATEAVRPAVRFDGHRARSVRPAPLLDQHGNAIRAALERDSAWPHIGRKST